MIFVVSAYTIDVSLKKAYCLDTVVDLLYTITLRFNSPPPALTESRMKNYKIISGLSQSEICLKTSLMHEYKYGCLTLTFVKNDVFDCN